MLVSSIHHVQVGRVYEALVGPDGLPVLKVIEGRGRPRGLTGEQVIAARALRNLGKTLEEIATVLDTSIGAVRTAIGAPR